ncbi:MAG TPA: phosphatidate cytidylyltransferase [Gemmataceae bacterium]|nr:phosphatidate cytidylyltransferase [Gemmataceae bacterium]
MLATRLWMGAILIGLTVGGVGLDQWLAPWYPFLFVLVLLLTLMSCHELLQLLGTTHRPSAGLCFAAVAGLVIANWLPTVGAELFPGLIGNQDPWLWVGGAFAVVVLAAFVVEMAAFQVPGESVVRISLIVWIAAYLGLLPSFFVQLRWLPDWEMSSHNHRATAALMMAIFVPKCGDIGAYFTGRLLGRHRMAPTLSPKKTWEGAAGGVTASVLAAVGLDRLGPVVRGGWPSAALLGAALGITGMVGDLAESLIKRDCRQKDASQAVPGFGGVLDVVDSIVFAAPVAYWWIK